MNLFILRHGIAVEPGTAGFAQDSERPLTQKGERKLWTQAEGIEALDLSFDWILSSPYVRARQTAEIMAEALGLTKKVELSEALAPGGSVEKLIELINHHQPGAEAVLLVGHEPYLSNLISLLISGSMKSAVTMKKGGLCKLAIESLQHGRCATLEWLLTPKQLCLLA